MRYLILTFMLLAAQARSQVFVLGAIHSNIKEKNIILIKVDDKVYEVKLNQLFAHKYKVIELDDRYVTLETPEGLSKHRIGYFSEGVEYFLPNEPQGEAEEVKDSQTFHLNIPLTLNLTSNYTNHSYMIYHHLDSGTAIIEVFRQGTVDRFEIPVYSSGVIDGF